MSAPPPVEPPPAGVIHDIGYQPYEGARLGEATVARALLVTGYLNAFGVRRAGRAKVLPVLLAVFLLVPVAVMVSVMITTGEGRPPLAYGQYPVVMSLLISVFLAAQAPTLLSRDLRYGTIALYLARPLRPATYALMRWSSLMLAVFTIIAVPQVVLYVGALLAGVEVGAQTQDLTASLAGGVLLASLLATFAGVVTAWTVRRGLAIAGVIVVLLVGFGLVSAVQAIAVDTGNREAAELAGLFSPWTLYEGVHDALLGGSGAGLAVPDTVPMGLLYLGVSVALCVGGGVLLVHRYRGRVSR